MNQLTLLIKPASSLCSMRCRYCFYADEAKNRQETSLGIMQQDTVRILLEKAMACIGENGTLSVVFQGGEPTLAGEGYFRSFTELAEKLLPPGAEIRYSVQTNGYDLSDAMLGLWREHRFLVGLSLDGCRALHDGNRLDAAGAGTWSRILGNLRRIRAAGLECNALCVITGQAAREPQKIYRTLKQLGFRHHQYIPCLEPLEAARGSMPYALTPEDYGRFLKEIFDLWYGDWRRGDYVSVRTFEDLVFNAMGLPCGSCAASGVCGQYLLIEADGSAYPCDFYALDGWKLGNIREKGVEALLGSQRAQAFARQRTQPPRECGDCAYRQLCRTGCFRDWEHTAGGVHNYYCPSFRALFDHALPRLLEIARAEKQSRGSRQQGGKS